VLLIGQQEGLFDVLITCFRNPKYSILVDLHYVAMVAKQLWASCSHSCDPYNPLAVNRRWCCLPG